VEARYRRRSASAPAALIVILKDPVQGIEPVQLWYEGEMWNDGLDLQPRVRVECVDAKAPPGVADVEEPRLDQHGGFGGSVARSQHDARVNQGAGDVYERPERLAELADHHKAPHVWELAFAVHFAADNGLRRTRRQSQGEQHGQRCEANLSHCDPSREVK
jgi:hypothetical protein